MQRLDDLHFLLMLYNVEVFFEVQDNELKIYLFSNA